MSIAQLSVAGEDETRPAEQNSFDSTPAADAILCCKRNLPHLTLRAHQRALSMSTLPLRARCALAAVALTVDCREPLKEVFAHRDYLAERAGLSERTWYRAEADLILAGLIRVAEQGRKARHGRFGSAFIYLTDLAARMLGLIGAPVLKGKVKPAAVEATAGSPDPRAVPAADSAAHGEQDQPSTNASFAHPSANVADPYTNDFYQSPSSQKRQPGTLPADLERLLTLGFHKNLVFMLMKEARLAGKLLSDVVECCWEPLKKAHRPISYLRALLAKPVDFARQRKIRVQEDILRDARAAEAAKVAGVLSTAAGKTFVDIGLTTRFVVSDDGQSLIAVRANEGIDRVMPASQMQRFACEIAQGRVRVATAADLQIFTSHHGTAMSRVPIVRPSMLAILKAASPRVSLHLQAS